jgi:hypothetical protein
MPHQEKVQLIIDELDKDISGSRGLDNIKARLAFQGEGFTKYGIYVCLLFPNLQAHGV